MTGHGFYAEKYAQRCESPAQLLSTIQTSACHEGDNGARCRIRGCLIVRLSWPNSSDGSAELGNAAADASEMSKQYRRRLPFTNLYSRPGTLLYTRVSME